MATLSQLLALPELGLRLVQAGPGDPALSWASTTELLDLGEYLEGGEIVLTTGLALRADDPRWRDFVAALSRARVAAIGFGVGVTHERIPMPLIAAASTYRVALLEVPPPVPFIAVSKAVAGLLRADELRAAQLALRIHQRLLDGARGPQNTAEVLASIAQATGRQLAVVGADDAVIAGTAGFFAARREAAPGGRDLDGGAISIDEASGTRLLVAGGEALGPEERAVVAAGAMVLGLGLRGERSDDERERSRWARLVDGLLDGTIPGSASAVLDPGMPLPERVRAIAVLGPAEAVVNWRRRPRAGLERLVSGGRALGAESGRTALRTEGTSIAWQLCPNDAEALDRALEAIAAHGLDAVLGRPTPLDESVLSRRSAAARIDALSPVSQLYAEPRTPKAVWADRASPLLDSLLADSAGSALSASILGPLTLADGAARQAAGDSGMDAAERDRLRETLRVFLERNGQRGPAATALGIHRNTLRDRLLRVERLLMRSVNDPDDRAELWLALRAEEARS